MVDSEDTMPGATSDRLRALPGEAIVPPGLEDRVVAALRRGGAFAPAERQGGRADGGGRRQIARWAAVAAILLGGVLGGFVLGRGVGLQATGEGATPRSTDAGPRYLLLLHEDERYQVASGAQAHRQRVEEYTRWARKMRERDALLAGEELGGEGTLLDDGGEAEALAAAGDRVAGYFLIRAAGDAEALTLARSCPHLTHGGRIEVRRIRSS